MNTFTNKKIFIAPKTPISMAFKEYLDQLIQYDFLGYIDKTKIERHTTKIDQINNDFDYIIIISPNHYKSIYSDYISLIDKEKLYIVNIVNQAYQLTKTIQNNTSNNIEYYSKDIDSNNNKREGIVFISKGFIDANNKYLFLSCLKQNIYASIVTDNLDQIKQLEEHNLPCRILDTNKGDEIIAKAKYIVFDQANYTYFYISPNQITIQLWHGVGLKKMSKLTNITYDYFISTSNWTNETNFKNVFCAKTYCDFGYPRNDILLKKDEDKLDLLFCNKELYKLSKNNKTILYMPTIREYVFSQKTPPTQHYVLPLDLKKLNEALNQMNFTMIIKLHPYVIEFFKDLALHEQFTNIKFHPTQGDIYPILKYTDILITDYSSIAYDFLFLDKPIIFFDYDRDMYEKNMGGFLFDYDKYSPGIKVKNQDELIEAIKSNDNHQNDRIEVKNKFFSHKIFSSKQIIKQLING